MVKNSGITAENALIKRFRLTRDDSGIVIVSGYDPAFHD
jgi:hypothetical protein